ncbi:hypothetical protein GOP47_0010012 [Adiantum capillus-veneris]|uniref:Uncharacterized protein n=1 Tax=Adiantum capillus-veneris TaxID=13818 RepID=A0A9D4UXY8_ADICA|nr:hypothetical protein GOP47_0010012 [Adiantum capillus-veneris]
MQSEDLSPDAITYACILKVYESMQGVDMGTKIHNYIVSQKLLKKMSCLALPWSICMPNVVGFTKQKKCLRSFLFGISSIGMETTCSRNLQQSGNCILRESVYTV